MRALGWRSPRRHPPLAAAAARTARPGKACMRAAWGTPQFPPRRLRTPNPTRTRLLRGSPRFPSSKTLSTRSRLAFSQVYATTPPFYPNLHSISMARGGGARPSGAPRIPARAPRATRAHIWRAFPPETSGPATRPRRGLAPRRPGGRDFINSLHVTRSPHPANPAALYDPCACSKLSRRVCILRGSRTAGGSSRFETQGCTADGTAYSPELWRAATSASIC
jgi:hypothetical protein